MRTWIQKYQILAWQGFSKKAKTKLTQEELLEPMVIYREYAIEGWFSEKSDVFSFGVLLLEIVSGRRNSSPSNNEDSLSLLGFTWKSWNEKKVAALIDPRMYDANLEKDILRCIHIGLLCVQELARERPSMSTVVSMLSSEIVNLPPPKQPAFIQWQSLLFSASKEESQRLFSNNKCWHYEVDGR
ncbi:hypothetical protein K1719_034343 [Acacia pycnantha]|nr:hypothetical protein K1719_034343 [Acacia pycnantha]